MTSSYVSIKGKIVDFSNKLFGLFIITIQSNPGNINDKSVKFSGVCGKSTFIATYDIATMYSEQIADLMKDLISRGEANRLDSRKLEGLLSKNFELFIKMSQQNLLQQTLENTLVSRLNIVFDAHFTIYTATEMLNPEFQLSNIINEAIVISETEEEEIIRREFGIPFGIDIIHCTPILSPINGVLVKNIQKGDYIYCYPSEDYESSKTMGAKFNLLSEKNNNEFDKLTGQITSIKNLTQKKLSFVVSLTTELVGVFDIEENLKIEVPSSESQMGDIAVGDFNEDDDLFNEGFESNWRSKLQSFLGSLKLGFNENSPKISYILLGIIILIIIVFIYSLL